jgi:hypothetical protein
MAPSSVEKSSKIKSKTALHKTWYSLKLNAPDYAQIALFGKLSTMPAYQYPHNYDCLLNAQGLGRAPEGGIWID